MSCVGARFVRYFIGDERRHVFLVIYSDLTYGTTMDIEKAHTFTHHWEAVMTLKDVTALFGEKRAEVLPVVIDYDFNVPPSYPRDAYKGNHEQAR